LVLADIGELERSRCRRPASGEGDADEKRLESAEPVESWEEIFKALDALVEASGPRWYGVATADVLGGKNSREKKRASAGRAAMRSMILDMVDGIWCTL